MMAFRGVYGVLACCLAVWDARDVVSLAMGWWASFVYEMRLRFYKV